MASAFWTSLWGHALPTVFSRPCDLFVTTSRHVAELSDTELGAYTAQLMAGLDAVKLGPGWVKISEAANAMLDCNAWGPPPWAADRWETLAVVLQLAQEAAAGGCCCPSSPCMASASGPPSHPNRKPTTSAHSASPGPLSAARLGASAQPPPAG
jgi:hypothetical protein